MPLDITALAGGFAEGAGERLIEFGVGAAIAEALRPEAVALGQEAWKLSPTRAVDPNTAALIVAENVQAREWGAAEAVQDGIDGERFDAIVGEILNAPGVAELLETWRRGLIDDAMFEHGLRKAKLEPQWDAALRALKNRLLDVDQLANARQQGFIDQARQLEESALQGIDAERAEILFDITGLPPGAAEAMQAVNRGLADEALFAQMIREGHTKTKYTDLLYAMRRALLTPTQYVEGHLRGWIDAVEMNAGAALHGMEPADTNLLFELSGRPIAEHQVVTGEARGGTYNGPIDQIPAPFLRALQQSSIRPEWYNLAYANRYTYPAPFVLRLLATTGELSPADVQQTLLDIGWKPDFAEKVTKAWTGTTTAKADAHVTKAETQLWSTLHKSYVDGETQQAEATTDLQALGVASSGVPQVLALWDREREIVRRSLTEAQIKKAYGEKKFARDEALARLERLGLNAADAATVLDE